MKKGGLVGIEVELKSEQSAVSRKGADLTQTRQAAKLYFTPQNFGPNQCYDKNYKL